MMLPCLLDQDGPVPDHCDPLLLYIDNCNESFHNALSWIDDDTVVDNETASKFREYLYSPFGPSVAALNTDKESYGWIKKALQDLLDSTAPYARSFSYWRGILQHYVNRYKEGCRAPKKAGPAKPEEPSSASSRANNGKRTIDSDVKEVFEKTHLDRGKRTLTLPPETLPRDLYQRVKRVMADYDGKWSTSKQAFVFKNDSDLDALREAVKKGKSVNQKVKNQAFFTPE